MGAFPVVRFYVKLEGEIVAVAPTADMLVFRRNARANIAKHPRPKVARVVGSGTTAA